MQLVRSFSSTSIVLQPADSSASKKMFQNMAQRSKSSSNLLKEVVEKHEIEKQELKFTIEKIGKKMKNSSLLMKNRKGRMLRFF